jgi:hypothetical protein
VSAGNENKAPGKLRPGPGPKASYRQLVQERLPLAGYRHGNVTPMLDPTIAESSGESRMPAEQEKQSRRTRTPEGRQYDLMSTESQAAGYDRGPGRVPSGHKSAATAAATFKDAWEDHQTRLPRAPSAYQNQDVNSATIRGCDSGATTRCAPA